MSVAAPELVGRQEPTIRLAPAYVSTSGPEAIELARQAGLLLDPWQQLFMTDCLGERADGKWAAFEAAILVARQNGKGGIFEARALAGLFLLDEKLIMYSAHEFKTAAEMFRRIEELIAGASDMRSRVKRVTRSHGEEGIELKNGQRLRFFARSTGSGRGFSGNTNIWDEAQHLGEGPVDAMMPTMSAQPNPQLLYGGSAPDRDLAPCEQISRVRRRALAGDAQSLVYHEYSAELCGDLCGEACTEHDDPADPQVVAKTNPGLGIRISLQHVERERDSMSPRGYARERLSVGRYALVGEAQWAVIPEEVWRDLADAASEALDPVAFAIDTTPEHSYSAIAMAGLRADGLGHSEIIDHRPGTAWTVERMVELRDRWKPVAIVVDAGGPAGSLIADLEKAGLEISKPAAREFAQACGSLYSATGVVEGDEASMRYVPHPALNSAVAGADKKVLADAWKWNRRSTSIDISPLVAATLARWGFATFLEEKQPPPAGPSKQTLDKYQGNELFRPTSRLKI